MKPATLLKTWKTLPTVLLEHDKFREEHFQQCLVSFALSVIFEHLALKVETVVILDFVEGFHGFATLQILISKYRIP